jgi:hypothetical protein
MDTSTDHPSNPAEVLISGTIQAGWILYFLGGLYLAGPMVGWTLALMACWRLYIGPALLPADRAGPALPVLVWLAGMGGCWRCWWPGITNDLGVGQTIKSVGWAKGWALLGLYPFAGAVLSVRSSVVYRAICRLAVQTLILLPFMLVAPMIGLPGKLYVSPLSVLGGSGPEFFVVMLYIIDPENGARRWQFYAPWPRRRGWWRWCT